ncbi:DoxX family protein [Propionibacteriaceae bacterium Y1700]|uniref:DoxX family protein n=1 Tax=Microlunatus sp. Y1700 TaxID=3418487 RepID=UPI003DA70E0C
MRRDRPPAFVRGMRHLVLLISRVVLGLILIGRGWHRWQADGLERQTGYLIKYGVPYADQAAWASIILEIVGGVFLLVGALTPLIALALVIEQSLIIAWTKWWKGPWLNGPGGDGFEYTAVTLCLALVLLVYGAGRVSVDGLFRRDPKDRSGGYDEYDAP